MHDTTLTVIITAVITLLLNVAYRIFSGGIASGAVAQRLGSIEQAIIGMQGELKQMTSILIDLANVRGEIKNLEHRADRSEEDIRDLRRGRGFIQEEIRGEYPKAP